MASLSFDPLAALYDETRTFDPDCFDAALNFVVEKYPPDVFGRVLEPGVGTGRIAIPLAERGYQVTGVDISDEMLAILSRRAAQGTTSISLTARKADVTDLPFASASFDLAVVVHLFYFVGEWQRAADEILRVVGDDGRIVLMHTGAGAEIPFLNARYKELCAELGSPIGSVGVNSTEQVVDYYSSLGCQIERIRDRWRWTARTSLSRALDYLRSRAYSFTASTPADVHSEAIARLDAELRRRYGSLEVQTETTNEIRLVLVAQA